MIPPVEAAVVVHHDLAQHEVGLVILVEGGLDGDLLAHSPVGPQRLTLAALVVADDGVGRIKDMLGGTVVLLETNGAGAGVLLFKIEDVLNVGAAETVDALVIVAHHADVAIAPRQQGGQAILQMVGVLILVDQHVAETAAIVFPHFPILLQQMHRLQNQIIEVQRVGIAEFARVKRIHFTDADLTPISLFLPMLAVFCRTDHLLLGAGDGGEHLAGGKCLFIQVQFLEAILDDPLAVVGIVDGKVAAVADAVNIAAQDAHTGGVEGGCPYIAALLPQHPLQALLQLVGSLVGEGNGQHLVGLGRLHGAEIAGQGFLILGRILRVGLQKLHLILGDGHGDLVAVTAAAITQQVGNAMDQHRGLAASGTGQQQQRSLSSQYTLALHGVQFQKIRLDGTLSGGNKSLFQLGHGRNSSISCCVFPIVIQNPVAVNSFRIFSNFCSIFY